MTGLLRQPSPDFDMHKALAADGSLLNEEEQSVDIGLLERMHAAMLRARRFDERRLRLQRQGDLGTFAPAKGQEAAQVGAVSCLEEDDWFVPAFRETAAALWRASMEDLFVVTAGWNEGIAMQDGERTLPDTVPVASQLPIAVGIAHAGRRRGEDSVVMTVFGDGATSEGDFHEAMNFATVLGAPVVFLCQNNGWAISTPLEDQTASTTLAQKAHAYGMPAARVDGNDVLAVQQVTEEALARAREEGRPSMIEAVTYRMEVHTTADDPTRYREEQDVERWEDYDPIDRARLLLEARSQLDEGMLDSLESQIEEDIDAAWDAAKARIAGFDDAAPDAVFAHMFEEPTAPLRRQEKQFAQPEDDRDD
ncbi:hypothetical protein A3731_25330 [Roseovarius sp. HI0049]|nr:hypothetical protein A3731_25330 [Roseovarius sp. HI0049]